MALQTLLQELGLKATITVHTDSSAAKASAEKPGLMHMKHMQLRELFLKQVVQEGFVVIEKVNTLANPADMLTKPVTGLVIQKFWRILSNCWTREFEVNVIEVDTHVEPGSWSSLSWLGLAVVGVIWFMRDWWRAPFSSISWRTSRAYGATEMKSSFTKKSIDANKSAYDDVYENDENVHQHIRDCCQIQFEHLYRPDPLTVQGGSLVTCVTVRLCEIC